MSLIFGSDLGSLVESVYLEIPYTDNQKNYDIVVNPTRITYIIGKTVIINKFTYPKENIKVLLDNRNRIISRVWLGYFEDVIFDPYLPRLNLGIQWNGDTLDTLGEENIEMTNPYYSMDSDILFFPKVRNYRDGRGERGELNFIGYLLYQTGLNLYDTPFKNLDVVKCRKGI